MNVIALHQNPALGGGPMGWSSCSSACTAMLVAFVTNGANRPSGGDVRAATFNANGSPDTTGGTTPSQNVAAAKRFGVDLDYQVMDFDKAWALSKRTDTMLSFSISYVPISGTRFDGSPGFRGLHQVVRTGGKVYDPLADGRRPGIPTSPEAWPKDLLRRAAAGYAVEGKAAVIVAKAPAVNPTRFSVVFEPGRIFLYGRDAAGKWFREPSAGVAKRSSAPCTAPTPKPWAGGVKRLAQMTVGKYAGFWVEPTAAHMKLVAK